MKAFLLHHNYKLITLIINSLLLIYIYPKLMISMKFIPIMNFRIMSVFVKTHLLSIVFRWGFHLLSFVRPSSQKQISKYFTGIKKLKLKILVSVLVVAIFTLIMFFKINLYILNLVCMS